ncbi:hypothetical protein DNTS_020589 [Danionella cerebrum]|uniref:C2H2-type domain-containing protein n=1 Tax=Danionella cerebrum TaxID=2873325 RepID=A0A553R542_9TELE|nr:hypothetical protein DNTS_020589 [Danionella translucida]
MLSLVEKKNKTAVINGFALYSVALETHTQGTMEHEEDFSTRDPEDLMSNPVLLPSTSASLLNCTFMRKIFGTFLILMVWLLTAQEVPLLDTKRDPLDAKDLFFEKIPLPPLELETQGDVMGTPDSSLPKQESKLDQDNMRHSSDPTPNQRFQKERKSKSKLLSRKGQEEKNTKVADVYTFPGDSEPESPPPGPWAHCTFIQRKRKKRALLRPFSGLGTWHLTKGVGKRPRGRPPGKNKNNKLIRDREGVFEFKEVTEDKVLQKRQGSVVAQHKDVGGSQDIFTCVECSIYFKKRTHLWEHMREHGQTCSPEMKGQSGEKGPWIGRLYKKAFDCMECGQDFADKEQLLDHQRYHEDARLKILEEIGKLNDGNKQVMNQASCSNTSEPVVQESTEVSYQKSSNQTQTNMSQKKTGSYRTSPRFQQKTVKNGQAQFSEDLIQTLDTSPPNKRYPIRASKKPKETPDVTGSLHEESLTSQNPTGPKRKATNQPVKVNLLGEFDLVHCSRQTNNSKTLGDNTVEDTIMQSQHSQRTAPRTKDTTFRSIGNKRTGRGTRGRKRGNARLYYTGVKRQAQISKQTEEKCQNEELSTTESQGSTTGNEQSIAALDLRANSISPKRIDVHADKDKSDSLEQTADDSKLDEEDDEEYEEDDDIVNRIIGALTEEDDESDREGFLKSVERKCPYCPDRFHNGIGLANHIRGHLNRVGVSYNVRHFISPEEVNAIEKKFSYQKKKKKVANFDPSTFSVMRCEFCSAGFDTRAGLSSHARAHLRDFGITNWEVTVSPINVLRQLFAKYPNLVLPSTHALQSSQDEISDEEQDLNKEEMVEDEVISEPDTFTTDSPILCMKKEEIICQSKGGDVSYDDDDEDDDDEEEEEEEEDEAKMHLKDEPLARPGDSTLFSSGQKSLEPKDTDSIGIILSLLILFLKM